MTISGDVGDLGSILERQCRKENCSVRYIGFSTSSPSITVVGDFKVTGSNGIELIKGLASLYADCLDVSVNEVKSEVTVLAKKLLYVETVADSKKSYFVKRTDGVEKRFIIDMGPSKEQVYYCVKDATYFQDSDWYKHVVVN